MKTLHIYTSNNKYIPMDFETASPHVSVELSSEEADYILNVHRQFTECQARLHYLYNRPLREIDPGVEVPPLVVSHTGQA